MTCKDCIHKEACSFSSAAETANHCRHYEDKSRFVELPCKVGDTVYFYAFVQTDDCDGYYCVDQAKVSRISIDCDGLRISIYNRYFDLSDIGKTVFLTREEAEKKLEEMQI